MTDQLLCPQCHMPNRAEARFCSNCGAAMPGNANMELVQLAPGRVMNSRYTILHSLGRGGMGAVYLASETIANRQRQVVVKEMLEYYDPDDPQGEAKARQRFETEAGTLVSLNFAGIPQIFDFFSDVGRNFIIMQFIEGQNLETGLTRLGNRGEMIAGEPYPVDQVRRWGIQLCKVLENLAMQNVVHLDIKPANLILDRAGDVWLVDFGTAKAQWVTQSGGKVGMQKSSVYGTAGYAPPEQYAGQAEPRSDIYALAATLYHLLTDDDPRDHPFKFPKLGELPTDIGTTLERALNRDVNQRSSPSELRSSLDARPADRPAFRWKDGTVCRTAADLVDPANRHWEEARAYFLGNAWEDWLRSAHRHDLLSEMARLKDGRQPPDQALDSFLRTLNPNMPAPILHLSHTQLNAGTLRRGQKRNFHLEIANRGSGWLRGRFNDLPDWVGVKPQAIDLHTSQKVIITVNTRKLAPRIAPHRGQLIIDAGLAGRVVIPAEVSVEMPGWQSVFQERWSIFLGIAILSFFLVVAGALFSALMLSGNWRSITSGSDRAPLVEGSFQQGVIFTSNRDGKSEVYRLLTKTGAERVTRSPEASESWSALTAPGGDVLFTSDRDGKREIYRLTSSGIERVTHTPGEAESWSPIPVSKGEVLFVSDRDGKREIYRLTNNGAERVTATPGNAESWSPAQAPGGDILFTSNRSGKQEIYRLSNDGVEQVTNTPGSGESWFPAPVSTNEILFVSDRDGKREIYRLTNEGVERVTQTPGSAESWAPLSDGSGILFSSNRDGKIEIYRLAHTGVERVTRTLGESESWLLLDR